MELILQEMKQLRNSQKNKVLTVLWLIALAAFVVGHTKSYQDYRAQRMVEAADLEEEKQRALQEVEQELALAGISKKDMEKIKESTSYMFDTSLLELDAVKSKNDKKFLSAVLTYLKSVDVAAESFGMYDARTYGEERVASAQEFRDYMYGYYEELEGSSGEFWNYHRMTGLNFLYRVMEDMMPFACIALALLMAVDSLAGEKESGSLKCKLLLPMSRGRIVAAKIAGGALYSVISLFLPVLVLFFALSAVNGVGSKDYLVLEDAAGIGTTEAIEGTVERVDSNTMTELLRSKDSEIAEKYCVGISQFLVAKDCDIDAGMTPLPSERLKFAKVGKFLFQACLYQMPVVLLSVSIGTLISLFANKRGIAVAIGVLAAFLFCAAPLKPTWLYMLNPGAYKSGVGILGGTAGVTSLGALLFLGVSLAVVWGAIFAVHKRQDILC